MSYEVTCHHGRFTERHCEDCQAEAREVPALKTALAAAQARERTLREALVDLSQTGHVVSFHAGTVCACVVCSKVRAALATPPDDAALREFGLRVAIEVSKAHTRLRESGEEITHEAIVDAVLRGER